MFQSGRHVEPIVGGGDGEAQNWRSRERMKTVSVALVVCLNVGVDPPGKSLSEIQPANWYGWCRRCHILRLNRPTHEFDTS